MKNKNKFKRKLKKNSGSILLIGIASMIGIAAHINLFLLDSPAMAEIYVPRVERAEIATTSKIELIRILSDKPDVEIKIREIADEMDFKWPDYLVRLAIYESSLNPKAIHKNNNGTTDRGLFQWNDKNPPLPGVDDKCAFDIDCSTRMTIKAINMGLQSRWMADKKARLGS